jgi:uncharacterized protein YaeQ
MLKATLFKAELQISDLRRDHYRTYNLTVARHPSENDERMMVRLLAFALYADEDLVFTRGLCVKSEPELWIRNTNGDIPVWIELGQPDDKRIRRACGRAGEVVVISYGDNKAAAWWRKSGEAMARFGNLAVLHIPMADVSALQGLAQRSMKLQVTLDDRHLWLTNGETTLDILPQVWMG